MSKRTYIQRKPRFYLDVDGDEIPNDFKAEDSTHPRVYFRAPTWGDRDASIEAGESEDSMGMGMELLARCLDSTGGDFALCLHEGTRAFTVPDSIEDRVGALKALALPDLTSLIGYVHELCSPTTEEAGESDAPAG